MGSLSARVKISLILSLLVFTPPAAAQDETLTGWFTFMVADYPTESGLASEVTYELTEDSGERHELLIDVALMQPLGGPVALNRKRVTVVGEWEEVRPDVPEKFRVSSIELAASPSPPFQWEPFAADSFPAPPAPLRSAPLPAAESDSQVRGSQAWVTILCRFGDATNFTPHPVSHYEKMMGSSYPALGHYWNEVSYGNIPNLSGSIVVGWYNLPRPRSYYVYDRDGDGKDNFDSTRLKEDCIAAADADVFFPDFWGINLIFNGDLGRGGFASSSFLTMDGQQQFYGVTALSLEGSEIQYVWAHEMGHTFGLMHSSGPYGQDDPRASPTTYDSKWDVMSGGGSCRFRDPEYTCIGVHTIAYHKDFLGWIPSARKYVAPRNSTRTITLKRLAQPGSDGYLMAQIPIGRSRTDFYTVETRLFTGYDDEIPDEAVVIHKVDTTRADRLAQVVDIDNNGDPNDEGAMWTVGEIFTDRKNALQVSIDATNATSYRVTINTNPATFSTCIAFLSSSSHLFGPGGDSASVQVEAAGECTWAATSNADWIRVTAGGTNSGSGRVRYTVTANPSPAARTGTLTIGGWTFTVTQAGVNEVLFEDDMESGTEGSSVASCTLPERDDCSLNPYPWELTTASSYSGTHAWTDSPNGNYQNNVLAEFYPPRIDLTEVRSATLVFWHRYDFARGDQGVVVVHLGNDEWTSLRTFTGTNAIWRQVSLDLSPFVGQSIRISFLIATDAAQTADGWYIDDVAVFSSDFAPPPLTAALGNPAPNSPQSGIGLVSGWACDASEVIIEFAFADGRVMTFPAAVGTQRPDTIPNCGHADTGFGLTWNWNIMGDGTHTVRAYVDGVLLDKRTVTVTTLGLGDDFPEDLSGHYVLQNFPKPGDTTPIEWSQQRQNFVIADSRNAPSEPGGWVNGQVGILGNPSPGTAHSGVAIISGWHCTAQSVTIELLNGHTGAVITTKAGAGTERGDTAGVCGDTDNGFGLLWNWNILGDGWHTVRAFADEEPEPFSWSRVFVTTLGLGEFPEELRGEYTLDGFPAPGQSVTVEWRQEQQNFVITGVE